MSEEPRVSGIPILLHGNPSKQISTGPTLSDEELMRATNLGNCEAFDEIVRRHQQRAWAIAYRFLGCPEEARDIVQDAFLRVLAAASRYRPTASFRTYLATIVIRLCLDHAGKRRPIYTDAVPHLPDPSSGAIDSMIVREREAIVRAAMARLPARQRMAVVLKYFESLDYRQIAEVMQVTEKAVDRLLSRGRAMLARSLEDFRET